MTVNVYTTVNSYITIHLQEVVDEINRQTNILISQFEGVRSDLAVFSVDSTNQSTGTLASGDGRFTRLIKGQTTRIINGFKSEVTVISDLFAIGTSYTSGDYALTDGRYARLFKGQVTRVVNAVKNDIKIKELTDIANALKVGGSYDKPDALFGGDGALAQLIRGQTTRIIEALKKDIKIKELTDIANQLKVGGGYDMPEASFSGGDDGGIARLIRGQTTRIIDALKKDIKIQEITDIANVLKVGGSYDRPEATFGGDGGLAQLIRGQTTRIVDAIKNINIVVEGGEDSSSGAVVDMSILNDLFGVVDATDANPENGVFTSFLQVLHYDQIIEMIDIQTYIGEATAAIYEVRDAVLALDFNQIINQEAGTNFWDFFSRLFSDLFDFLNNLMDFLTNAFVPEDTTFMTEALTDINTIMLDKLGAMNVLSSILTETFNVEEKEFADVNIELPVYGTISPISAEWVNKFIPMFKNVVSAFLVVLTGIWAYRKITNEMIT